jgi:hypothetical protein
MTIVWLWGSTLSDGMCICGHNAECHDSGAHEVGAAHWGGCEARTCPCRQYEDEDSTGYTLVERTIDEYEASA